MQFSASLICGVGVPICRKPFKNFGIQEKIQNLVGLQPELRGQRREYFKVEYQSKNIKRNVYEFFFLINKYNNLICNYPGSPGPVCRQVQGDGRDHVHSGCVQ